MTLLTVGVIGGMGPSATVDFMDKLIRATKAPTEAGNLRLLVDCNPHVPDRHDALTGGADPGPVLAEMAAGLQRSGADFVVMACNTAHAYEAQIKGALTVPFVSLIAETVQALATAHPAVKTAGLLATSGCIEADLYQAALKAHGVETLVLDAPTQARFMDLIHQVKGGDTSDAARAEMRSLADVLIAAGAEVVVSGCTEIPLVLAAGDLSRPLVESTSVLVARTLAYARDGEALPN